MKLIMENWRKFRKINENSGFEQLMSQHSNIEYERTQDISRLVLDILNKTALNGQPDAEAAALAVDQVLSGPEAEFAKDLIDHTVGLHNSRAETPQVEPEMGRGNKNYGLTSSVMQDDDSISLSKKIPSRLS